MSSTRLPNSPSPSGSAPANAWFEWSCAADVSPHSTPRALQGPTVKHLAIPPQTPDTPSHKTPLAYPPRFASDLIAHSGILDAHIARASPVVRAPCRALPRCFFGCRSRRIGPARSEKGVDSGRQSSSLDPSRFKVLRIPRPSTRLARCALATRPAAHLSRPSLKPQPPVSSRTSRSQAWLHFPVDHRRSLNPALLQDLCG